ncbi:hypothetical protein MNBD_GAMMA08-1819 [hydrothermal vent metagenome]|uniref:DUF3015 domain-containing protein n=1 Tax=hydrothermal vent metagenome TaxID=652676 RepID=A0A3B0Y0U8_9ZZZZ
MNMPNKILVILPVLFSLSACSAFTEFSSSTSDTVDAVTPDVTLNEFVNKRYVAIRHDAANGGGENLDALAQLLGAKDKVAFAKKMKANFNMVFKGINNPSEIIARIETQMILDKA